MSWYGWNSPWRVMALARRVRAVRATATVGALLAGWGLEQAPARRHSAGATGRGWRALRATATVGTLLAGWVLEQAPARRHSAAATGRRRGPATRNWRPARFIAGHRSSPRLRIGEAAIKIRSYSSLGAGCHSPRRPGWTTAGTNPLRGESPAGNTHQHAHPGTSTIPGSRHARFQSHS